MKNEPDTDVIVVGAGLAGLSPARRLESQGYQSLVLEYRSRPGGRTRTLEKQGYRFDMGGEFVGESHSRVLELIDKYGLTTVKNSFSVRRSKIRNSKNKQIGPLGLLDPRSLTSVYRIHRELEKLGRNLDPEKIWRSEKARELDRKSVAEWLDELNPNPRVRYIFESLISGFAGVEEADISLLQLAWWIALGGGPLTSVYDSVRYRIKEGAGALSRNLASDLDTVRYEEKVTEIEETDGNVEVRTDGGRSYCGRYVVAAVGINVVDGIRFDPPLEGDVRRSTESLNYGSLTKINLALDRDVTGRSCIGGEPVSLALGYGRVATGFAYGDNGELDDEKLAWDLMDALEVRKARLLNIEIKNWGDCPYTQGNYVYFKPGQITDLAPALNRSHGRTVFASAERSSCPMWMEGAVESGYRASDHLTSKLKTCP
ncbi:MAG: flavin monoamine oxidase family protein [Halobacteria archaeon]